MAKKSKEMIPAAKQVLLLTTLETRFKNNMNRHRDLVWESVAKRLKAQPQKVRSLYEMEMSGGEPDVLEYDKKTDEYIFYDCALESPVERRSLCYDRAALNARKENKPKNNVEEAALTMGIELLNEEAYRTLQRFGKFDAKTSSWIKTPEAIRKLGGALFCDLRYNTIFVYHNGAESYYASRGFRGLLRV